MKSGASVSRRTQCVWRGGIYLAGLVCLSFGLMLCTKTGLGASAVTSAPFAVSQAFQWSMTLTVFLNYTVMVLIQLLIKKRGFSLKDLAQIPFCALNSALMGWFGQIWTLRFTALWQNLLLILWAIVMVGVGAAMIVKMDIVAQPPEALAQTISQVLGKDLGFGKNLVDLCCVALAAATDLLFGGGKLVSVGVGTVLAMILVGRVISVFDRFCIKPLRQLAGLEEREQCGGPAIKNGKDEPSAMEGETK